MDRPLARTLSPGYIDGLLPRLLDISHYEAIRLMATRLERYDQARSRVTFAIEEAPTGAAWIVRVRVEPRRPTTQPMLDTGLQASSPAFSLDALELEVKSDIGALEIAGHSLFLPREPEWKRAEPARKPYEVTSGTVEQALTELRRGLARALESRVRRDLAELRAAGRDIGVVIDWGDEPSRKTSDVIDVQGEVVPPEIPLLSR